MSVQPDDTFDLPEAFGPGSVWADRVGHRSLIGCTQKGVEIPIGHGEGEASPGELLKLALIGCAGMTSDQALSRRLGDDYKARFWAHGLSDAEDNRYHRIEQDVQLELDGLDEKALRTLAAVFARAVAAGCTVERTVVPGAEVVHRILGIDDEPAAPAPAENAGTPAPAENAGAQDTAGDAAPGEEPTGEQA